MNTEQIQETLDMLAARFGATGEYLWEVLVRQQIVEAWMSVVAIAIGALAFIGFSAYAVWHAGEDAGTDIHTECAGGGWSAFAGLICAFITVVILLLFVAEGLPRFINPEFYALKELLP